MYRSNLPYHIPSQQGSRYYGNTVEYDPYYVPFQNRYPYSHATYTTPQRYTHQFPTQRPVFSSPGSLASEIYSRKFVTARRPRAALTYTQCEIMGETRSESETRGRLPEISACEEEVRHAACHMAEGKKVDWANVSGDVRVADLEKAKAVMRSLNPGVNDDDQLMALLMDHMNGRPLRVSPDLVSGVKTTQTLLPVGEPPATQEGGYRATHEFKTQLTDGESRVFTVVKVVESPAVLAVAQLLIPNECASLYKLADDRDLYKTSVASIMNVKIEDRFLTFQIPNDLHDVEFVGGVQELASESACFTENMINKNCYLLSFKMRASAVCRCQPDQIQGISIQRIQPGQKCEDLHFSNKRQGAVILFLTEGSGMLAFPAAGMEISAKQGMSLYIPSVHPDTLPGVETDTPCVPDLRTKLCLSNDVGEPSEMAIAIAYVSLPAA